jgi:hypothetical protein
VYIDRHIKYRYACQIFMKVEFSRRLFEKSLNIKCNENSSSGNRIPCGQTDMTTLIVAFRNFTNEPNKQYGV